MKIEILRGKEKRRESNTETQRAQRREEKKEGGRGQAPILAARVD